MVVAVYNLCVTLSLYLLITLHGTRSGVTKTIEPTAWVHPMVVVRKVDNSLRLCMDPKELNKYVMRQHYHLPHKSEMLSDMAGAQYFSKLDAAQGFYQLQLDEESSKLCTIATPFGRYSFQRLPFGISSASEIFHRTVASFFDDLAGVKVFVDDIVVWGASREQHDARLHQVLQRVRSNNIKLNRKKCVFGVREITFLGDKLSSKGVQPDE